MKTTSASPDRLARRWFWALLLVAVTAMGTLYAALGARPGPGTGLIVLVSGCVLIAAVAQAARILMAVERARHAATPEPAATVPASGQRVMPVRSLGDRLFGERVQKSEPD